MAATAQDSQAPLRGPEKKDEDREDESKIATIAGSAWLKAALHVSNVACSGVLAILWDR